MQRTVPAAAVGALAGAMVWAILVVATGYEFGLVAWGVGALAGGASMLAGGKGQANGAACAVLALLGIFLGKVVAARILEPQRIRDFFVENVDLEERYAMDQKAAREFAGLSEGADLREFVARYRYTEATTASEVTDQDVAEFHKKDAPVLRWMAKSDPSFNTYAPYREDAYVRYIMAGGVVRFAIQDLAPIDALFALLGLGTAFRIGSAGRRDTAVARTAE